MNELETIVGEQTIIQGDLRGDEDLTVLGRVEGSVTLTKTLIVESQGIVQADMDVRNAEISGVVVGNIVASEYVRINDGGRMVGDISAPRVIVVSGASFRGHVDMGNMAAPRSDAASHPVPSRAPASPASRPSFRQESTRPQPTPRPVPTRAPARATKPAPSPATKNEPTRSRPAKPAAPKSPAKSGTRSTPKGKPARKPPKPPSAVKGKKKVKKRR
ncbi:MAG: polymer-forming cytoskeletal protein [Deltaproteobacteria bacterium]|nr:polymer-forming cytoskeletal protein [Deltaproteobacteria bacterium]